MQCFTQNPIKVLLVYTCFYTKKCKLLHLDNILMVFLSSFAYFFFYFSFETWIENGCYCCFRNIDQKSTKTKNCITYSWPLMATTEMAKMNCHWKENTETVDVCDCENVATIQTHSNPFKLIQAHSTNVSDNVTVYAQWKMLKIAANVLRVIAMFHHHNSHKTQSSHKFKH